MMLLYYLHTQYKNLQNTHFREKSSSCFNLEKITALPPFSKLTDSGANVAKIASRSSILLTSMRVMANKLLRRPNDIKIFRNITTTKIILRENSSSFQDITMSIKTKINDPFRIHINSEITFSYSSLRTSRILYTNQKDFRYKLSELKKEKLSECPFDSFLLFLLLVFLSTLHIYTLNLRQQVKSKNISKSNQICFVNTYSRTERFLFGKLSISLALQRSHFANKFFFATMIQFHINGKKDSFEDDKICFLAEIVIVI